LLLGIAEQIFYSLANHTAMFIGSLLANIVTTQNGIYQLLKQHSDSPPEGFGQGSALDANASLNNIQEEIEHEQVEILWKAPPTTGAVLAGTIPLAKRQS
jgi:hypothetical protein